MSLVNCRIHAKEQIVLEPLAPLEPKPDEVVIRLGAGGICGSDLHLQCCYMASSEMQGGHFQGVGKYTLACSDTAGKIAAGKLLQAFIYGAKVVAIHGNFDDALRLVREPGAGFIESSCIA